MIRTLSIIIPVFNEAATLPVLLERVTGVALSNDIRKELIVVNDHSTDESGPLVETFRRHHPSVALRHLTHERNRGKGAAVMTGIRAATGDYIIIQDADLEYDPEDYNRLLAPVLKAGADVVYGSRFIGSEPHRILFYWHSVGNRVLTRLSNMLTNLNLTDMETGYKLFRADVLKGLTLKEKRFGFEPEVTAKIARIPGVKIFEVGISYYGRTYKEGKKIKWKDGVWAILCILRYGLF